MGHDTDAIDLATETLLLLALILGSSSRLLARASPGDARLEPIRDLADSLQEAVLDYWDAVKDRKWLDHAQPHLDDLHADHDSQ